MQRSINIFDKLGSLIPGYKGYAERNNRRQSEKLLRDRLYQVISSCEKVISNKIAESIKIKNFNPINELEECRKKLNTFGDKIQYAPYGESAFFSNEQLKEDELLIIYQKDLALLERLNDFYKEIPDLDTITVLKKISELEKSFTVRNEYIKEFK
jgi:hypothetical protein